MERFLRSAVLLDVESSRGGDLCRVGAARGEAEFDRELERDPRQALRDLDAFAAGAGFLLGHNLLGHDLDVLRKATPDLALLRLPVIDTLYLSPIAFPENPYHRLVKDYKLVGASRNDPVADARLAASVFTDQWRELARVAAGEPRLLPLYAFAFTGVTLGGGSGDGLAAVFRRISGEPGFDETAAGAAFVRVAVGRACAAAVPEVFRELAADPRRRPEISYLAAWLRVAGSKSVQPPWLRHRFPGLSDSVRRLRDSPCGRAECPYCSETADPEKQLARYFGFPGFRETDGRPLQREIALAGMGDRPLLALMPTGGGKSLCFQLPGLVRHARRGALTIVISPLQALIKDQADGLTRKTESHAAAALCGLLTPIERREVLDRTRLGDVAILYVSPEQLRNPSFGKTVCAREIGAVVVDEAHCLSKWGHDFRPDYFYVARFFRELAKEQGAPVPPIACFTATAKPDVVEEIAGHFRKELGQELAVFRGPVERENLRYEVREVPPP
ncbi:MAG: DEAD/DEAH box helicase, partial [Planctomycetes bacterium]|nr:DEAD/DEAH box helicase [Planctomycetota bacterium]